MHSHETTPEQHGIISHRLSVRLCLATTLTLALLVSPVYAGPTISLGSLLDEMVDSDAAAKFPVAESGKYGLSADLTKAVDYGIVRVPSDGRPLAQLLDLYNNGVVNQVHQLGTHDLTAGNHQLTVDIVGANPRAIKSHMFGIDYRKLERVD